MAIRRVNPTGVATGGSGADYGANACGTINEASAAAADTYIKASTETTSALTATWSKGTAAVPNRYVAISGGGGLADLAALIDPCEASWVNAAGSDVATIGYNAGVTKNGTANKLRLTFDATPKANTLQAYKVVNNLSLSAFRNICWWFFMGTSNPALSANNLVIKLCTGNDGATGVVATLTFLDTCPLATSYNVALTLDNGSALPNGVNSIAIYTGSVAPPASVVWQFDTFYATVAGFDLNSVIKKPFRYKGVAWAPNTAIALNEIRVPTFAAACPLVYKCVQAGTTAATENFTDADGQSKPIWDKAYLSAMGDFAAQRVTDGTCIWEVQGDDEAFYLWTIKSLDVTRNCIEIDNHCGNVGNAGRGYYGTDEATSLAWLTPYLYPMAAAAATVMDSVGASGTDAVPRTIRGGYNTSDEIVGVTVISGRNGLGYLPQNAFGFIKMQNIVVVRAGIPFRDIGSTGWNLYRGIIACSCTAAITNQSQGGIVSRLMQHIKSINVGNGNSVNLYSCDLRGCFGIGCIGPLNTATSPAFNVVAAQGIIQGLLTANCSASGACVTWGCIIIGHTALLNLVATYFSNVGYLQNVRVFRAMISDSAIVSATGLNPSKVLIQDFGGVKGDNRAYYCNQGQATYTTATHLWTLAVTSANATAQIPMRHKIGQIKCDTAGVAYVVNVPVTPSHANLICQLKLLANTIAGVQFDTYAQSSGSGLQTLTVTFTPLEVGYVELFLDMYTTDGVTTYTVTYDLDSLTATKNAVALRVFGIGDELFGDEMVRADTDATFPAASDVVNTAPAYGWVPDINGVFNEALRNTITAAKVENAHPYKHLNVNMVGTQPVVIPESHTANQVLVSAGGNYNDTNLTVGNVRPVAFGLGLTGDLSNLIPTDAAYVTLENSRNNDNGTVAANIIVPASVKIRNTTITGTGSSGTGTDWIPKTQRIGA